MQYKEIDQEDIATALKAAGSNRKFIDRQDYVAVMKEMGAVLRSGRNYLDVDDQDIPEFIIAYQTGINGVDDMALLKKEFSDMTGMVTTDLFQCNGRVAVYIFAMTGDTAIEGVAEYGPELVVNGDFTGGTTGWALGTGWSYGDNNVVHDPAENEALYQSGATIPGLTYLVELDASGTGSVAISVGDSFPFYFYAESGHAYEHLTPVDDGNLVVIVPNEDFDATVDNVSVKLYLQVNLKVGVDSIPGSDDDVAHGIFLNHNVTAEGGSFPANTGWQRGSEVPVGDYFGADSYSFRYLNGHTIRFYVEGGNTPTQGSVTIFAQWFPLEDGATLEAL